MTKLTTKELRTYNDRQIAAFLASLAHRFKGTEAEVICKVAEARLRVRKLRRVTR